MSTATCLRTLNGQAIHYRRPDHYALLRRLTSMFFPIAASRSCAGFSHLFPCLSSGTAEDGVSQFLPWHPNWRCLVMRNITVTDSHAGTSQICHSSVSSQSDRSQQDRTGFELPKRVQRDARRTKPWQQVKKLDGKSRQDKSWFSQKKTCVFRCLPYYLPSPWLRLAPRRFR